MGTLQTGQWKQSNDRAIYSALCLLVESVQVLWQLPALNTGTGLPWIRQIGSLAVLRHR